MVQSPFRNTVLRPQKCYKIKSLTKMVFPLQAGGAEERELHTDMINMRVDHS